MRFGLVPDYIGRGLGPALLDWALERAWSYRPRRVWLHTCSLAMNRRAGLEVYVREVVSVELESVARSHPVSVAGARSAPAAVKR